MKSDNFSFSIKLLIKAYAEMNKKLHFSVCYFYAITSD